MQNYQTIKIWDRVLKEYCHCYPDEVGNHPCDNGSWCTRCLEKDVQEIYHSLLKREEEKMKKNMIWSYDTSNWDEEEMRNMYEECYEETPSDETLQQYISDVNSDYLGDVKSEIDFYENKHEKKEYIVLADLGLWNGRFDGGKIITGLWNAISKCFEDYNEIYEEKGRLKVTAHHHDVTNYFQIKELTEKGEKFAENHKWDLSDRILHQKLFNNSNYSRNVKLFKEVYGW